MSSKISHTIFSALDIGTTKIVALIAKKNNQGSLEIIGVGQHPSHGLKKGIIVNIAETVDSIKSAVHDAIAMAGVPMQSAYVGISGAHISSINSTGVVAIKGREVSQYDIDRVVDAAKAVPLPKDHYILHVLPQYFRVDGQEFILDSLGMYGVRLESQVHIVTGAVASAQNIIRACELAGIAVSDIVLEPIASASAVLTQAEQEMGAGLIDIGGGTSDFAIYKDNRIRHSKILAIAGNHFTNDIALGFKIPFTEAEIIKKKYGSALKYKMNEYRNAYIDVPLGYDGGVKTIKLDSVVEIVHFRAEEIFEIFGDEITSRRLKALMPCGLVLTGGGSLLDGVGELATEILQLPVRIGTPQANEDFSTLILPDFLRSPVYATVCGLLLRSAGQGAFGEFSTDGQTVFSRVLKRMKSWVYDLF